MKVNIPKKLTPAEESQQLREALAELQEREKQREKNWKPKHDFTKPQK